jgi:hypothetical protein
MADVTYPRSQRQEIVVILRGNRLGVDDEALVSHCHCRPGSIYSKPVTTMADWQ